MKVGFCALIGLMVFLVLIQAGVVFTAFFICPRLPAAEDRSVHGVLDVVSILALAAELLCFVAAMIMGRGV